MSRRGPARETPKPTRRSTRNAPTAVPAAASPDGSPIPSILDGFEDVEAERSSSAQQR